MRINFLPTDRFPYTAIEIILAGLILRPTPTPAAAVCADCGGALPADVVLVCQPCLDRAVA